MKALSPSPVASPPIIPSAPTDGVLLDDPAELASNPASVQLVRRFSTRDSSQAPLRKLMLIPVRSSPRDFAWETSFHAQIDWLVTLTGVTGIRPVVPWYAEAADSAQLSQAC